MKSNSAWSLCIKPYGLTKGVVINMFRLIAPQGALAKQNHMTNASILPFTGF
jgi:hypothetical protein